MVHVKAANQPAVHSSNNICKWIGKTAELNLKGIELEIGESHEPVYQGTQPVMFLYVN